MKYFYMNEFVSLSPLIWCITCFFILKNADPHGYDWPTVRLYLWKFGHRYIRSTPVFGSCNKDNVEGQ